jgi:hypothetical protein
VPKGVSSVWETDDLINYTILEVITYGCDALPIAADPAASIVFFHTEPILVWIACLENGYEGQFSEPTRRGSYP